VSLWSHAATLSSLSLDGWPPFAHHGLLAKSALTATSAAAHQSVTSDIAAMPATNAPLTTCTAEVALSASADISADAAAACRPLQRTAAGPNAFCGCGSPRDCVNMPPSHPFDAPAPVILPATSSSCLSLCSFPQSSLPGSDFSCPAQAFPHLPATSTHQSATYSRSVHHLFSNHLTSMHPFSAQAASSHASQSPEAAEDSRTLPAQRPNGSEAARAHARTRGLVGRSASFGDDPAKLKASMPPKRARAC